MLVRRRGASPRPLWTHRLVYVYRVWRETRYASFDIATEQRRPPVDTWWPVLLPYLVVPILAHTIPLPETKILLLLLAISSALEAMHTLLHPSCRRPLFYRPFAAPSLTAFWSTHWQAAAASPFRSLAYRPGSRIGGRWLGVLLVFNLSGMWHAWASAAIGGAEVALRVWVIFIAMGVGCVLDRRIWGSRQSMMRRLASWVYALALGGWAWRALEQHQRLTLFHV